MLQLYQQFGSRSLIDTLHSHGFCASYDELRLFLSTSANHDTELVKNGNYVPQDIIPRGTDETDSSIIHEGDDNVDIQRETVDGNNTYHSMARVIFQDQVLSTSTAQKPRLTRPKSLQDQERTLGHDLEESLVKPVAYVKPKQKPEFPRFKDPQERLDAYTPTSKCPRDLSWCLLRQASRKDPASDPIPFWTGFNAMLTIKQNVKTTASYLPTIEAPPTDMATVYTVLKRGKELTESLGQHCQIHTFDQQLYALAQQVKWARPEEFQSLTNRLGGFHTLSTFTACIGKIWGDSGLKDLLVESNVYASNTVDRMLTGHQFHRTIRGLTLAFEVLTISFVSSFFKWMDSSRERNADGDDGPDHADSISTAAAETARALNESSDPSNDVGKLDKLINSLIGDMERFEEFGCCKSPTFKHWIDCIDALQLLLCNIRAEREGNWKLHIQSVIGMMPYFFMCNRQNYARWASIYAVEMVTNLPPEAQKAFDAGQFSIKRTAGRYNGIWSDMGVESTVIRDSKSRSGVIYLGAKGTSILRWTLTRQLLGRYSSAMLDRSGCSGLASEMESHEQQKPAMLIQNEKHAQQMLDHMNDNFIHPFEVDGHPSDLVNISTGLHASEKVQQSLLTAKEKGTKAFHSFVHDRLSTDGTKSIWDPISRSGLTTFTDLNKPTKLSSASRKIKAAVSAEVIFRRSLAISETRPEVNLTTILSRPITAVPTMLFKEDGSRQKTSKAELLHWLEDKATSVASLPPSSDRRSIYIIDGMADVQAINGDRFKTFVDIGEAFLGNIRSLYRLADEVHLVYDRYDEKESVKADERCSRMTKGQVKTYSVVPNGNVPPWKKFLGSMENKQALAQFLSHYLIDNSVTCFSSDPELSGKRLFVSGGFEKRELAQCASLFGVQEVEELEAIHEEADTRMIFHLVEADKRMAENGINDGRAIIRTPDTDVVCLAVHHFRKLSATSEIWVHTGSANKSVDKSRFIPIHDICSKLGPVTCHILPAVHALTGCDTVSSLHFIGKQKTMKIVSESNGEDFKDLADLGSDFEEDSLNASRRFIIDLYDPKCKHRVPPLLNLNDLRVRLAKRNEQSLSRLPPCEDSLRQHVRRASWQTKIWMRADQTHCSPSTLSPIGHGWRVEEGRVVPVYFEGETAAEILDDLVCSCSRRGKCAQNCSCSQNNLPCIDLCSCKAGDCCTNPQNYIAGNAVVDEY